MTRQETVEKYKDAFLEGRTDEQRAQFQAKDINKQYASIKQWMRKGNVKEPEKDSIKLPAILKMVRSIQKTIEQTPTLSDKDLERIHNEINLVSEVLNTYNDRVRKAARRKKLERDLEAIIAQENKTAQLRANIEQELSEL